MGQREFWQILSGMIILTAVIAFIPTMDFGIERVGLSFIVSVLIITVSVFSKKIMAHMLDADVEHEIWKFQRYGFRQHWHFKKEIPGGIIFPLFITFFTLGFVRFMGILTYETKALKVRAAKRFGTYSYTEMSDFHNGLIGAAGIVGVLILSVVIYLIPISSGFGLYAAMVIFYAFFNMLPISKLDGTQIFFGSRILYATIGIITLIFTAFALTTL